MLRIIIIIITRQIREFSTSSVSTALSYIPSAKWLIAGDDIYRFFDIFGKNNVSLAGTFSIPERV